MDSINDLLSSISPEDLAKLKNVAAGLMNNGGSDAPPAQSAPAPASAPVPGAGGENPLSSMLGGDMTKTLMTVASQMNKEDDRTRFIKALQPLLSDERRKKADDAMKFLRLMEMLPLVKGFFNI